MIKTSAMFSAHAIHVLVRNTLIFFIILFIGLFAWLSLGIEIDTFKFSKYRVEGLYLKLDKKLILKAQKVSIPLSKASPSTRHIGETFENIKYLLTFFKHIDLKEIHFNNNILAVYYSDNILQVSSNDYLIRGNIRREGKMLKGTVPILQLKKRNILLRGDFSYDLHDDILETKGTFLFQKISGDFNVTKMQKNITFSINSDVFSDLHSLVDTFNLSTHIKTWIVDKVQAKKYELTSLKGKGSIQNKGFVLDTASLTGQALLKKVKIYFKEGLDPISAQSGTLTYNKKHGLVFDLDSPTYLERKLDGSEASIRGLDTNETMLTLNLHLDTPFDTVIHNILKAYDIHIPFTQKTGNINGTLKIDIGLKNDYFDVKSALILSESNILIGKMPLHILSGQVSYEKQQITLKNISIQEPQYEGILSGTIHPNQQLANLVLYAQKVQLKSKKQTIFNLKHTKLPFSIDYNKHLIITIPKLSLTIKTQKDITTFKISDLKKVKSYVTDSEWFENGGELIFKTKDFKTFQFQGIMKPKECFFYEKQNVCKTRIPFHGTASKKNVYFYAFGKRIRYDKLKSHIHIKDINIDLKVFLEKKQKNKKTKKQKKSKTSKKTIIIGENSNLRYDEYSLILDSYDVEVSPSGNIKALGSSLGDIIKFSKIKDNIAIQALRIKDKVLHPLINFKGLKHGRYSIKIEGSPQKIMKGQIIIEGGIMKDFKAYNNTAAFVKTVPSLASLHKAHYSKDGFQIEEGVIEYRMIKRKKIIFDSIYIRGSSATLVGKGTLDLEKKMIDIDLQIHVARTIGKVLGSIPLLGYILMGEDKSITVGLKISGTLNKPIVKTSAITDILSSPLGIIKRTFESPSHIINQQK